MSVPDLLRFGENIPLPIHLASSYADPLPHPFPLCPTCDIFRYIVSLTGHNHLVLSNDVKCLVLLAVQFCQLIGNCCSCCVACDFVCSFALLQHFCHGWLLVSLLRY